jgi:threonine aldolase
MRQAGVLAAAGLYALNNHIERLADDHAHAALIASVLDEVEWAEIDPRKIETNLIYFETTVVAQKIVKRLEKESVRFFVSGPRTVKLATCLEQSRADIDVVCEAIRAI